MFPEHEIDNSYDQDTGEPFTLVVEVKFGIGAAFVVPDEDTGLTPAETQKAMKEKTAIAVGFPARPETFVTVYVADTPLVRERAEENVKNIDLKFVAVDFEP